MSIPKNTTYERVYSVALEFFGHDKDKTHSWWLSKCEEFGNKAPYEMVKEGKGRQLLILMQRCM